MTSAVCKTRDLMHKHNKSISDRISQRIADIKDSAIETGQDKLDRLQKLKTQTEDQFEESKKKLTGLYLNQPWRKKRPDIAFMAELGLVIVLAVILFYTWPYLTGSAKPAFTKAQFTKATKIPESAFNIEELAKVKLEVKSIQDYGTYFTRNPYSRANNGIHDLMVSVAILPFIIFFVQFVLPPFVLMYIVWFIVRYWPYVYRALWGWFIMLYRYFTRMIQGKMGCKWYIRMVTGWGCHRPRFSTYFYNWRRRYIDRPIYYEKLRYLKRYHWAKERYYIRPMRKYVTLPYKRYKVKAEFIKKVYVDRALEVFLKKVRESYPEYYTMPRNRFYKWLLGNNRNLAAVYAKAAQAKAQIEGKPYRSLTKRGKQCTCPGTETPVKMIQKKMEEQKDQALTDVDLMVKATNEVYDTITEAQKLVEPSCEKADTVIRNRHWIGGGILGAIIVSSVALYAFSAYYGTPVWLKHIITPTSQSVMRGMTLIQTGKSYWSLPLIYLAALSTMASVVMFV